MIKVSGPTDGMDRRACRIPVLAFKSRWNSWGSFGLIQLTARLSEFPGAAYTNNTYLMMFTFNPMGLLGHSL